jgi:hypothetical protein
MEEWAVHANTSILKGKRRRMNLGVAQLMGMIIVIEIKLEASILEQTTSF